ncbi:MAG: hypothetical protein HOK57_01325 [Planctomycetaceae bacterium]|nr:hypothetical protein [Planctomycetaceae bacterium]MBT6458449.1 hypothetical protein [Planctomycetaceae bacterium]
MDRTKPFRNRKRSTAIGRISLQGTWIHGPEGPVIATNASDIDADESLVALKAGGHRLEAFSNNAAEAVEEVLRVSGLRERFEAVVSCDAIEIFKPNPVLPAKA